MAQMKKPGKAAVFKASADKAAPSRRPNREKWPRSYRENDLLRVGRKRRETLKHPAAGVRRRPRRLRFAPRALSRTKRRGGVDATGKSAGGWPVGQSPLAKPLYLALAWMFICTGCSLWLTPFPGGIFLVRWGVMLACKASPKLRTSLSRRLGKIWLGSRLLPV
jgi:hypothetical protein